MAKTNGERQREYRKRNPERIKQARKQWRIERLANDPQYREHESQKNKNRKEYHAEWYKKLKKEKPEQLKEQRRKQRAGRYARDSEYGNKLNAQTRARRRSRYEWVNTIKIFYGCQNPKCQTFGTLPPFCLDFHHVDPKTKSFGIGLANNGTSKGKLIAEINKCIVLCANCHRIETCEGLDLAQCFRCQLDADGKPVEKQSGLMHI